MGTLLLPTCNLTLQHLGGEPDSTLSGEFTFGSCSLNSSWCQYRWSRVSLWKNVPPRDHKGTLQDPEGIWGWLSSQMNSGYRTPAAAALCIWFKAFCPVLSDNPFAFLDLLCCVRETSYNSLISHDPSSIPTFFWLTYPHSSIRSAEVPFHQPHPSCS